jgi:DNA polymerase III subunit gamma/tau
MEHHSLYRKYRPHTFADVIGQDAVVKTLEAAVAAGKPSHAYIFSGGRGIGKTSLARILASALKVTEKDVYEIDAASHNGVDEIRALRDGAMTLPLESPYKVYVLDEVHMLSKGAFNALLKILEEPPQHVIFILATTDIHKVPETILSRCEVYTLARPTRDVLAETVQRIAKKEKIAIDTAAADSIAELGDGSFRDTLSILQQIITAADGARITDELVAERTGAPTQALARTLLESWSKGDFASVLTHIASARTKGVNIDMLFTRLLELVRAVLLLRSAPAMSEVFKTSLSPDTYAFVATYAQGKDAVHSAINSKMLRVLLERGADIRRSPYPHMILELIVLESIESPQK